MEVILLVSPDKKTTMALSAALRADYRVIIADRGEQSLEIIRQNVASAVLIDSHVGDMSGFELLAKIRSHDKQLPLFMLGLEAESLQGQEALTMGVFELISDPSSGPRVRLSIRRGLETSRLQRELEKIKEMTNQTVAYPMLLGPSAGAGPGFDITSRRRSQFNDAPLIPDKHFYRDVIQKFTKAIVNVLDLDELMRLAVRAIGEVFRVNRIALLLGDEKRENFRVGFCVGFDERFLGQFHFSLQSGLCHWLINNNCILNRQEVERQLDDHSFGLLMELNLLKVDLAFPLFSKGKLIGVLTLANKILGQRYQQEDLEILSLLVDYLAVSIENALLYKDIYYQKTLKESILGNIGSGIIASDLEGRITVINRAAEDLLRITSEEIMGKNIQKIGSIYADIVFKTLGNQAFYNKHRIVDQANKIPIAVSTSLIRNHQGAVIGAVMVLDNLAEEEEREKKIKYLQQMEFWGQIATRLSQEINNPLATIKTFVQLLPEKYDDQEYKNKFYDIVITDIARIEGIIKKLMHFPQQLPTSFYGVNIHDVIESSLLAFKKINLAEDITILNRFTSEEFKIKVDQSQMEEVFLNLLTNCYDAIDDRKNGRVVITTKVLRKPSLDRFSNPRKKNSFSKKLEISFHDNGVGVPEKNMEVIFSPFFTTKAKGLGLGLTIAKRIIEIHGGEIVAESNEGKDSTFRILLPLEY